MVDGVTTMLPGTADTTTALKYGSHSMAVSANVSTETHWGALNAVNVRLIGPLGVKSSGDAVIKLKLKEWP